MKFLKGIITNLEADLQIENRQRDILGMPSVSRGEVILLGQFSLLVNHRIASKISLVITNDIDAWLKGDSTFQDVFKKCVAKHGYRFDNLSTEIWLPNEVTFETIYESNFVVVKIADPVSVLVSKAIKAKEKNRVLIKNALEELGTNLGKKIKQHGGDLEYFDYGKKKNKAKNRTG